MKLCLALVLVAVGCVDPDLGTRQQQATVTPTCAGLATCEAGSSCACGAAFAVTPTPCTSCHQSWTPNCLTCHMDFDLLQSVGSNDTSRVDLR
jgi:hypothetical protein